MGFLIIFRRPPPIRDAEELADFIDQQAAFVAQKGIYEYSRARAGHYAKVLFKEPEFQAACDVSRWRAFPIGLGDGRPRWSRACCGRMRRRIAPAAAMRLRALSLAVFDRYPVPAALGEQAWSELRAELERRLQADRFASAEMGEGRARAVLARAIST